MKKHVKALVLLLCVCLCWAGVAQGEGESTTTQYTVTLGDYDTTKGTAYLSLSGNPTDADKKNSITDVSGKTVYLFNKGENHYVLDKWTANSDKSDLIENLGADAFGGETIVYAVTLGKVNEDITVTPTFKLKGYYVGFDAGDGAYNSEKFGTDNEWTLNESTQTVFKSITYGGKITPNFDAPTIEGEPWYVPEWRKENENTAFDFDTRTVEGDTRLNAKWKFTVTLIPGSDNEETKDVTVYRDDLEDTSKYTLPECTFAAPAGKKFKGWKIRQSSDTTVYKSGEVLDLSSLDPNDYEDGLTLDAEWATEYSLTIGNTAYKNNNWLGESVTGGTVKVYASEADMKAGKNELTAPYTGIEGEKLYLVPWADTGYTFDKCELVCIKEPIGTLTEEMNSKSWHYEFTFGEGNAEINARFDLNQYTVTFDLNGGSAGSGLPASTSDKVYHGETDERPDSDPVKDSYTFIDWYLVDETTNKMASDPFDFAKTLITNNITLRAKWGATVTFDPNGGTGTMEPQTFEPNVSTTLKKNTFTRDGFRFDCWSTTPDGKSDFIEDEGDFSTNGDTTLYAQWAEEHTITVKVADAFANEAGFGVLIYDNSKYEEGTGVTSYKAIAGQTLYLQATMPDHYYVDENSWSIGEGGKGELEKYRNYHTEYQFTVGEGDATITVNFELVDLSYELHANGGKFQNGESTKNGTVKYGEYLTPEQPTYEGYTFAHWVHETPGGVKTLFDFSKTPITDEIGELDFRAQWNATVTYNANGAENFTGATQTALLGSDITLLNPETTPTKPVNDKTPYQHYRFNGWNTQANGKGTHYDAGETNVPLNSNLTLYAEWEDLYGVSVTIDSSSAKYIDSVGIYEDEACTRPVGTVGSGSCEYLGVVGDTVWLKATLKDGGQVQEWKKLSGEYTPSSPNNTAANPYKITLVKNNANILVKGKVATYTVSYDVNGGVWKDEDWKKSVIVYHGDASAAPQNPEKTDEAGNTMVFMGWFEQGANKEFDFTTQIKRNYTLYAKWGYTVTYKPGYEGATQDNVVDTVEEGTTYRLKGANTFTRTGYDLTKWLVRTYSNDPDIQVSIIRPTEFTAVWTPKNYNLIFDGNGGTIGENNDTRVTKQVPYTKTINVEMSADTIPEPNLDGYKFMNWYEKDANGQLKDKQFDFSSAMPANDVYLYAKWSKLYSITLHSNNGKSCTETLDNKYCEGVVVQEPLTLPTGEGWDAPEGKTFAGWNTAADGTGVAYDSSDPFHMPGKDLDLYAMWRESDVEPSDVIYHWSDAADSGWAKVACNKNDTTHTLREFDSLDNHTKVNNKKFLGWRVGDATTGTLYQPGESINLLSAETHVYGQWGEYTITVKCDPEEGGIAGTAGDITSAPGRFSVFVFKRENDGYVFDGWTVEPNTVIINEGNIFTMPEADVTVTAHFKKLYTVTFDAGEGRFDGDKQTTTVRVKEGTRVDDDAWPADPVRDHYDLKSWKNGDDVFTKDTTVNSDMTVSAVWERDKHNVYLNYNGGSEEGTTYQNVIYPNIPCGKTLRQEGKSELPTLTHDVSAAYEWFIFENGTRTNDRFTVDTVIDHDIIVKAMWKFTVKFDKGEGTVTGTQADMTGYAGEPITLPDCNYVREGYDFKGWMIESQTFQAGARFYSPTGEVTLTAKWEAKKLNITLDANGGTFRTGTGTQDKYTETNEYDGKIHSAFLTDWEGRAKRDGHTFVGWYTDAACTKEFEKSQPLKADITLYIKWEPIKYNITFDAGEGWWGEDTDIHTKPSTATYGTTATAPADPTRTSESGLDLKKHRFDGWFTQAEGGTAMDEVTITQDTTFHAHWTKLYRVTVEDSARVNSPKIHLKADHSDTGVSEVWAPEGTILYLDPNPSAGYRFDTWPDGVVVNGTYTVEADNNTIRATYAKQVKVTFDATQGGTFPAGTGVSDDGRYLEKYVDENSNITPPSPEPQRGFDLLDGWLYDGGAAGDNVTSFDFDNMTISGDTTLYANWKPGVGVVLDADGGTLADGTVSPQKVLKGGTATEPADPSKDECIFLGWYLENAETPFNFDTALDKTITLKARWQVKTYTITIETDGNGTASATPAGKAAAGTPVQLTATPAPGYCLERWEVVSGGVQVENGQFTMGKQDVTIKAHFGPAGVKVTFNTDGGTPVDPNPMDAVYGKTLAQVPATSKEGFTFQGWYEMDAETPFDFTKPLTGNVTLYARWTAKSTPTSEPPTPSTPEQTTTSTPEQTTTSTPEPTTTSTPEPTTTSTPEPMQTPPVNIIKQPTSATAPEGGKATFTVETQGDGLAYQWFVDRGDGQGFVPCTGATGATHTTTGLKREHNGYRYYCQITSKDGTLRTDTVTLTVEAAIPKTGDSANLTLWLALTTLSCAGMLAMLQRRKQTK